MVVPSKFLHYNKNKMKLGMIIVALIQKKPHHNGIWKTVQLMNLAVRSRYNLMTSCIVFGVNLVITFWLFWRGRKLRNHSAILMLGMVPIMTVAYYVAMSPVVKMLSSKISNLTEAMDHVAEGNLSIRIDTKNAGEFKKAYKQFNDMVQELERTKQQLMDEIWGYDTETDYNTIKVYVNRLRNKLKDCTEFSIISSRGVGYKAELKD